MESGSSLRQAQGRLFGEWVRARRKALDLTQFELAERAGCAEDTIGRIEAGTRRPSKQVATLLAEALGVPARSHADFVRFAGEGGSGAELEQMETLGEAVEAAAAIADARRSHPATWVPYLSSLPQPPTQLIGREDELVATLGLLRSRQARLLTLTGPPGVGKTRLALAAASALTAAFSDGICFVPLAPLRDPNLLALTVAHALGLSDSAGDNTGGLQALRLLDFLRHKRLLLVLDNFEQILAATHRVAEWLSASSHLQVLVTSRSALHLRGERLFPVSTLAVPPANDSSIIVHLSQVQDPLSIVQIGSYPSIELFVERAQAVDPSFRLTESNSQVVAELCRRMEGLPLAIELTAARSAHLSPELVLGRLEQRLDVARSGPRDLPYHQRTLRAAIGWSYDLLDEPERLLFDRMSVFVGGATFDAMEAVCNARGDIEGGLAAALEGLLQQSLVYRVTGKGDAEEERRFSMLEMLREYAGERLAERLEGEAASIGRYHAEYYLAMAEAADQQKRGAEQERWLNRLERDHDNLRAAIQCAIDSGEMDIAAGLCGVLWNFWNMRGYLSEGRNWLDKVLAHEGEISPPTLAKALVGAGALARAQGDYSIAISLHERSLAISRGLGDKRGIALTLNFLGATTHYIDERDNELDRAEKLYEESVAVWRELGDLASMAMPLHNLALIAHDRDDNLRAVSLFRECLEIVRANNDKVGICHSLYNLGLTLLALADENEAGGDSLEEAESCQAESLALAKALGHKSMVAMSLSQLGEIALLRGDESSFEEAISLFKDSMALSKELGDRAELVYALNDLGFARLLRGDLAHARSLFQEGLAIAQTMEGGGRISLNLRALAVTMGASALASSSGEAAERIARRAVQLYAASLAMYQHKSLRIKERYYEETMGAVGSMLPAVELGALEALGREMSIDEAVAFALAN